ncbi:MAG: TonB family protein [Terriglobia bacterium]|jgi:TonB family protein
MTKHQQCRHSLFLLALATLCGSGELRAQENSPGPNALPTVVDHKEAAALILMQSAPEYPPIAKINYIQGQVRVKLTVNGKGKVASAHVLNGDALLAESALKTTLHWIYHPLTTPKGPSGFITTVKVKFSLNFKRTDLTPGQAERDFLRQVKPPQIVRQPEGPHPSDLVHMRLLVNDQGQVVDMEASSTDVARDDAARKTLRGWTFRPAQWGTLPIASYLDVDVPVSVQSITREAANSVSP